MDTFEQISIILSDKMGIQKSEITSDASFTKDLGIDSLDYAEFILLIEQNFNIKIPYQEAESIQTVKQAVEYIENKKVD